MRAGHTEAAVDLARLRACIRRRALRDRERRWHDGAASDLVRFAREHDLKIISIADLVSIAVAARSRAAGGRATHPAPYGVPFVRVR